MDLPKVLVDEIRAGRCVLFTGAGATSGAEHPSGSKPPSGQHLAKLIAAKFLGTTFEAYPLTRVAELAASESSVVKVQTFVRDIFIDFAPAECHRRIPRFVWKGLATTNYDLVLERAYESTDRLQTLVPFTRNGQSVEARMRGENPVMYLKLHGSISEFEDPACPLILTVDQYVTHRNCRERLFSKLIELMWESPVVFAGCSLADSDIRQVLIELDAMGGSRPRSYLIAPDVSSIEERYFETKKITVLSGTLDEFTRSLEAAIPEATRHLALTTSGVATSPILAHLKVKSHEDLSHGLSVSLANDIEFVSAAMPYPQLNPRAFYKGYFPDWGPIVAGLDVRRRLVDQVLSEVILADEVDRFRKQELVVIKGHAGAGKTVLLRRLAYDAAAQYDALCFVARDGASLIPETLSELARLSGKRLFLFVDGASEFVEDIERVLRSARRDGIAITVLASERHSEWNTWCEALEPYQTSEYEVRYLSESEINELLVLLERHKSLGYLESLPPSERQSQLKHRAGRQLLVALHEATLGEPFEKIVVDEYLALPEGEVRSLYLTVSVLHRLDVPTRAGLISRVHGIPFHEFEARLFKPLEFIVFTEKERKWGDVVYRTRHAHIAEIVVESILQKPGERFDEYARLIGALDPDYSSDREALRQLMSGRRLKDEFSDVPMGRQLFEFALKRLPTDVTLLQQAAIYEMRVSSGNLATAQSYLDAALELQPGNRVIRHSRAEMLLRRSNEARTELERTKLRSAAKAICSDLALGGEQQPYPYHTLLKILLDELEDVIASQDEASLQSKIRDVEAAINWAMQRFPDEQFLRESESRFAALIGNHERSLVALKKAFDVNPRTPFIAVRLAKIHEAAGETTSAIVVLKKALDYNPGDKDLNLRLAAILETTGAASAEIIHHRRRSFSKGDSRFEAQFAYARALYLDGQRGESLKEFASLSAAGVAPVVRDAPRRFVENDGRRARYRGSIVRLEAGFAFVQDELSGQQIFSARKASAPGAFDQLRWSTPVTFELGFNFRGPIACNIESRGG